MSKITPLAGNDTDENDTLPPSSSLLPENHEITAGPKKSKKKPGMLAKRWGVQPNHFDYKNKIPKFVINDELTPWALAWIDKDQDRVYMLPPKLRQVYIDSAKRSRVRRFVDLEPGVTPQIPHDDQRKPDVDQEESDNGWRESDIHWGAVDPVWRGPDTDWSDTDDEDYYESRPPRLLYPASDDKLDNEGSQRQLGLHPTTGWGEVPAVELNELPCLGHPQGGSAPLPPPSQPTDSGEGVAEEIRWPLMKQEHPTSWIKHCQLDQEGLEKSATRAQETTGPDNEAPQPSHPNVPPSTSEAFDERVSSENIERSANPDNSAGIRSAATLEQQVPRALLLHGPRFRRLND